MKLKNKVSILLICIITIPLIVGILITRFSLNKTIEKVELDKATQNVISVKKFINSLADSHGSGYSAWTQWNDYYEAIVNDDKQWFEDNVLSMAQEGTNNEVLIVLDKNAKVLAEASAPKDWKGIDFSKFKLLTNLNSNVHYKSSIENTSEGLYITTITKVVESDDLNFERPNGYTLYARKLTNDMLESGKQIMNVGITIKLDNGIILSTEKNNGINANKSKAIKLGEFKVDLRSTKESILIEAQQFMQDSNGKNIGNLIVLTTSITGKQALDNLSYSLIILAILVIVLCVITIMIFRALVKRIEETRNGISTAIKESNLAIEQISSSMGDSNSTLEDNIRKLKSLTMSANEIQRNSDEILSIIGILQGDTKNIDISANKGRTSLSEITTSINSTKDKFMDSEAEIKNLTNSIKKITEFIDLIKVISHQTNLLSLNAAIEAARAGDAGRGFRVVADEVRKLASESKDSVEDINKVIEMILEFVKRTNSSLIEVKDQILRTEEISDSTQQDIISILSNILSIVSKIDDISLKSKKQNDAIFEITRDSADIENSFERIGQNFSQVSAAMEHQVASLQNLNTNRNLI